MSEMKVRKGERGRERCGYSSVSIRYCEGTELGEKSCLCVCVRISVSDGMPLSLHGMKKVTKTPLIMFMMQVIFVIDDVNYDISLRITSIFF